MRVRGMKRLGFLLGMVLAVALPAPAAVAEPTETTYYVDNRDPGRCNDAGPGTSPETPWCGFAPVNARNFTPGEKILLARNAVFAEGISVTGSGTAQSPITIDAYGSGARPRIVKNSTNVGVVLRNVSHWQVRNLDIGSSTNGKSDLQYGIRANYSTLGHSGLVFENLFLHDIRFVALHIVNNAPYTRADTVVDGIRIANVETTRNGHGIVTSNNAVLTDRPPVASPGQSGENAFRNIVLDRLYMHQDHNNNPGATPTQIDIGCPDGLAIGQATNVVLMNSILDGEAGCRTLYGTAAIYLGTVQNVLITNNIVRNTPNTMNPDMVAIDHESKTSAITIRGNYFANNFGGGIEYLAIHGANDFHTHNSTMDNVFINNGIQSNIPYPGGGAIAQLGNAIPVAATIKGNLYYEPLSFLGAKYGGDTARFIVDNNVPVADASDLYQAAADFSSPSGAWSSQMKVGLDWQNMQWNPADNTYRGAGAVVDQFTITPSPTTQTARSWTAPKSGWVNIRGFALATSSGSAQVLVTHNGRRVAGGAVSDVAGAETTVDDLRVKTGDVLRFEVAARGRTVSWTPSVGYSAAVTSSDPTGTWSFSANGDTQGWSSDAGIAAKRGKLEVTGTGDVTLRSPARLGVQAAERSAVRLKLYNGTTATSGTIAFTTTDGRHGEVPFAVNAAQPKAKSFAYTDYLVPMDSPEWTGSIASVTVTLAAATGRVSIDSIRFDVVANPAWEFTRDGGGWTLNPDVSCPSPGTPASQVTPDVDNSAGAFIKHANIAWTDTRMQTFKIKTGNLARLDLWAYKTGAPTGCLFLRIVEQSSGKTLFTGGIRPDQVTTAGDFVSIFPNLRGLNPEATYGLVIFAPYQTPGTNLYGIGYNDQGLYPSGGEFYSVDSNGTWRGPEASSKRSLKFRTFSSDVTPPAQNTGFQPVAVSGGTVVGNGGYEPVLLSPDRLGIRAEDSRYVRIRMNNPDNRRQAYLLFTTEADPTFDEAATGWPPRNEGNRKGITFPLVPGADYVEYVLDMSTVPGWRGTIDQLMVQPLHRWSYHITSLTSTWNGGIDYVRVD